MDKMGFIFQFRSPHLDFYLLHSLPIFLTFGKKFIWLELFSYLFKNNEDQNQRHATNPSQPTLEAWYCLHILYMVWSDALLSDQELTALMRFLDKIDCSVMQTGLPQKQAQSRVATNPGRTGILVAKHQRSGNRRQKLSRYGFRRHGFAYQKCARREAHTFPLEKVKKELADLEKQLGDSREVPLLSYLNLITTISPPATKPSRRLT